jgi:hypothetical protein
MSEGKPYRGVIVYDIELNGGILEGAEFVKTLKAFSEEFHAYLSVQNPELAKLVKLSQVQADMPLQERRGASGPLDQIVFRGTRGEYKTRTVILEFVVTNVVDGTLYLMNKETSQAYSIPIARLPKMLQNKINKSVEQGKLMDEIGTEIGLREELFRQNATQIDKTSWFGK